MQLQDWRRPSADQALPIHAMQVLGLLAGFKIACTS